MLKGIAEGLRGDWLRREMQMPNSAMSQMPNGSGRAIESPNINWQDHGPRVEPSRLIEEGNE